MLESPLERRRVWAGLVIVLVLAAVIVSAYSTRSDAVLIDANVPLRLPGATIRMESGFAFERTFSGRVMTYQDADLGFEVAGVVDAVLVAEGDRVEAGQALVRLRQSEQRAAVAEQQAALEEADAVLEEARTRTHLAELVRERRNALAQREALAQEALEMAQTDLDSHRARVRSAEAAVRYAAASLERLQVRLGQTELRAPFAGVIASLPARVGASLAAGAPAARLVDLDDLRVHVGLPVGLAGTLQPGAELALLIADRRHPARLLSVAPTVDAPARTVLAVLRPDGALPTARAGEQVTVSIDEWIDAAGAWLPVAALVEGRRGLWSGHFLRPAADAELDLGQEVERRPLQVVHVRGDRAFVRGPFAPGDLYLSGGLHRAVPGQRVRVAMP